jgi:hypothetical protein
MMLATVSGGCAALFNNNSSNREMILIRIGYKNKTCAYKATPRIGEAVKTTTLLL